MKKEYIVELREEEADELMDEHWVGELVRCKDCAFRDDRDGMCEHVQRVRDPDWYCADGERRYGDDEVGMADIKETIQGLYALKTYLASKTIEETIEENGPASESLIGMQKVVDSAVNLLKEQEAVVRCRYCRKNMMCEMTIGKPRDWYCADGEVKWE